jgi:hypothetical protein
MRVCSEGREAIVALEITLGFAHAQINFGDYIDTPVRPVVSGTIPSSNGWGSRSRPTSNQFGLDFFDQSFLMQTWVNKNLSAELDPNSFFIVCGSMCFCFWLQGMQMGACCPMDRDRGSNLDTSPGQMRVQALLSLNYQSSSTNTSAPPALLPNRRRRRRTVSITEEYIEEPSAPAASRPGRQASGSPPSVIAPEVEVQVGPQFAEESANTPDDTTPQAVPEAAPSLAPGYRPCLRDISAATALVLATLLVA